MSLCRELRALSLPSGSPENGPHANRVTVLSEGMEKRGGGVVWWGGSFNFRGLLLQLPHATWQGAWHQPPLSCRRG